MAEGIVIVAALFVATGTIGLTVLSLRLRHDERVFLNSRP